MFAKNPYISSLETRVLKRKYINNQMHFTLEDSLLLNYDEDNISEEKLYINNELIKNMYKSNMGMIYVLDKKIDGDFVKVEIDPLTRAHILRINSARYLIINALDKYLSLEAKDFFTDHDYGVFKIDNIFFDNQAKEILDILNEMVNFYIEIGLDIISQKRKDDLITKIDGLYQGAFLGHHLGNTSEIMYFEIVDYRFDEKGIIVKYQTKR